MKRINKNVMKQNALVFARRFEKLSNSLKQNTQWKCCNPDKFIWINPKPKTGNKALNFYSYVESDYSKLNILLNEIYLNQNEVKAQIEDKIRDFNFDLSQETEEFKLVYGQSIMRLKAKVDEISHVLKKELQEKRMDTFDIFQFWLSKGDEIKEDFKDLFDLPNGRSIFNYSIASQFAYFVARTCKPFEAKDDFVSLCQYANTFLSPELGISMHRSIRAFVRGKNWRPAEVDEIYDCVTALAEWFTSVGGTIGPVEKSAILHNELIRIQAYDDGNHRTARLLANIYLMSEGIPPVHIVNKEKRQQYEEATDEAIEQHDITKLAGYFHESIYAFASDTKNLCKPQIDKTK